MQYQVSVSKLTEISAGDPLLRPNGDEKSRFSQSGDFSCQKGLFGARDVSIRHLRGPNLGGGDCILPQDGKEVDILRTLSNGPFGLLEQVALNSTHSQTAAELVSIGHV